MVIFTDNNNFVVIFPYLSDNIYNTLPETVCSSFASHSWNDIQFKLWMICKCLNNTIIPIRPFREINNISRYPYI